MINTVVFFAGAPSLLPLSSLADVSRSPSSPVFLAVFPLTETSASLSSGDWVPTGSHSVLPTNHWHREVHTLCSILVSRLMLVWVLKSRCQHTIRKVGVSRGKSSAPVEREFTARAGEDNRRMQKRVLQVSSVSLLQLQKPLFLCALSCAPPFIILPQMYQSVLVALFFQSTHTISSTLPKQKH